MRNRTRRNYAQEMESIGPFSFITHRIGLVGLGQTGRIAQGSKYHCRGGRRWFRNRGRIHRIILTGVGNRAFDTRYFCWLDLLVLHENVLHQIDIGHQFVRFVSFETLEKSNTSPRISNGSTRAEDWLFQWFVRSVWWASIEVHRCHWHNPRSSRDRVLGWHHWFVLRRRPSTLVGTRRSPNWDTRWSFLVWWSIHAKV